MKDSLDVAALLCVFAACLLAGLASIEWCIVAVALGFGLHTAAMRCGGRE